MNNDSNTQLAVLDSVGSSNIGQSTKSVGHLRKLTLLDMTQEQVERVKILAEMQSNLAGEKSSTFFMVILKGLELGFSPMAAIDNISLIKGKPTVDGKGMLALVYGSGLLKKLEFVAETDKVCTIRCERKDVEGEFEYSFGISDAEKLGLLRNQQYAKQPKVMLKWRAVANLMRVAFPDVLGGVYTSEEVAPDTVSVDESGSMTVIEKQEAPKALNAGQPESENDDSKDTVAKELATNEILIVGVRKNGNNRYIVADGCTFFSRDIFRELKYGDEIIEQLGKVGMCNLPDAIRIVYTEKVAEDGSTLREPLRVKRLSTGQVVDLTQEKAS